VFTKVPEDAVGSPPALIVDGTYRDYMVGFWDMKNPHTTITRPLIEDDQRWGHRRNGIFLVYGNGVRQGFEASIKDNMDIGPTILYMMGLPLPANMDGRVMEEVFEGDKLARDPIALVRGYARVAEIAKTPGEQREDLESKLKSLGYIK
jgi:predicted AlkP superfamily phosphohydrolase/phosphomutase